MLAVVSIKSQSLVAYRHFLHIKSCFTQIIGIFIRETTHPIKSVRICTSANTASLIDLINHHNYQGNIRTAHLRPT